MRILAVLLAAALIAAACSSSDSDATDTAPSPAAPTEADLDASAAPPTEPTSAPEPTPEAPELELIGDGPYDVGATTIAIDADGARPLTVEIWFPIEADTADTPVRYTFITGDFFESTRAVAADAGAIAPDGPYPLVVYSHGSGGLRYIHADYTETLASHGYVVAAADHTGNTAVEQFLGTQDDPLVIAANRVADVGTVIDAMTDPADPTAGAFAVAVDGGRIAVTGHSFGGFTAYASVSGYPDGDEEIPGDDRIDAIIPLAPAVGERDGPALLSDDQLAAVDVPSLVIVGTDDKTTPVEPNVERAWELTTSAPHHRLELVAAEHQSFTDVCEYLAAVDAGLEVSAPVVGILEDFGQAGCAADDMATDRVQDLTNTFALRFLASVFAGDEMIAPSAVEDLGDILYDVK